MDGLSVATGILTLVGAVTKGIQIVKMVYDGPAELQALFNEGSDLTAILKNINAILSQKELEAGQGETTDYLLSSLRKANTILENLYRFIHQTLLKDKEESVDLAVVDYQVSKRKWLLARQRVIAFRKQPCSIREELGNALNIRNL